RPGTRADKEQKQGTEEHGPVGACLMGHLPETIFKQERNLGRGNSHEHIDDQYYGGEPRAQSQEEENPADDFYNPDKRGKDLRGQTSTRLTLLVKSHSIRKDGLA